MPDWNDQELIWPPRRPPPDLTAEIALAAAAQAKALDAKGALTAGPTWFEGKQLETAQIGAEADKREAEMKAKAVADREQYHRDLLEAERRRARGER